jgi:hypothetical protein
MGLHARDHVWSLRYSNQATGLKFRGSNPYLLTHSMVQSPSWAANRFAASQEIPRISRNPKVHYRTHKSPPPVSIPGQPNPVHISTTHLLEIRPNIIHPSTLRSPQWSLSLRFPHQDPIHPSLLTHTRHMPSPSSFFSILSPALLGQDIFFSPNHPDSTGSQTSSYSVIIGVLTRERKAAVLWQG